MQICRTQFGFQRKPFLSVDTNAARSILSPKKVKTGFLGLLSRTQMKHATRNLAACRRSFWRILSTRQGLQGVFFNQKTLLRQELVK
jgi:hypothetical protein